MSMSKSKLLRVLLRGKVCSSAHCDRACNVHPPDMDTHTTIEIHQVLYIYAPGLNILKSRETYLTVSTADAVGGAGGGDRAGAEALREQAIFTSDSP
jgi:hypothetical protein